MTENEAKSLFTVAGFRVGRAWELVNQYWGKNDVRGPWWLVQTDIGPVRIGWRKRVIEIEWEACSYGHQPVRGIVTEDDVTKDQTSVHAYSMVKAALYLAALRDVALDPAKHGLGTDRPAAG
jgi:hypothetical protein